MINMIIFSLIGTIGFSVVGVLFSIFKSKINPSFIRFLKGFTFSSIVTILFTGIFRESFEAFEKVFEHYSFLITIAIIAAVLGLFYLIHFIFDKTHHHHEHEDCDAHDFHLHESKSSFITSLIFLISISLHNIPEGLALGSAFLGNEINGILLSIVVFGLHNFVIAYTICESFLESKASKSKSIALTLLSSIVAFASAVCGYFIGNISEVLEAVLLTLSAGAMMFIIIKELLPSIIKNYDNYIIISIFMGLLITIVISVIA